jgi:hypothetical protein
VLSDEYLEDVRHMKERNLAVELLERLLKGEIRSRFKTNVVQEAKFPELLQQSLTRYRNRAIETAQRPPSVARNPTAGSCEESSGSGSARRLTSHPSFVGWVIAKLWGSRPLWQYSLAKGWSNRSQ